MTGSCNCQIGNVKRGNGGEWYILDYKHIIQLLRDANYQPRAIFALSLKEKKPPKPE